jgi:DNA-binding response OmpR family regulator
MAGLGLGYSMEALPLRGRSVLVVEDEPLIALDIVECFKKAGASVFTAHKLEDGLRLAGHPDLSAAVVDFGLSDGDGAALCERLNERAIPFVLHSGYSHIHEAACTTGAIVPKPASPSDLVSSVARLLQPGKPLS